MPELTTPQLVALLNACYYTRDVSKSLTSREQNTLMRACRKLQHEYERKTKRVFK